MAMMKRKTMEDREESRQALYARYENYEAFQKEHGSNYMAWKWYGLQLQKRHLERMKESLKKR